MAPAATTPVGRNSPKPPPNRIWSVNDPPFEGFKPVDRSGWERSTAETAIIIDNGSSTMRAGWSFDAKPRLAFPPLMARYRDRKFNRTFAFVGSDVYADGTARGQAKNAYEPGSHLVNNWDVMEGMLDYCFLKLGVSGDGDGGIGRPVVMTEPVANLGYTRKTMSEILFECYGAPAVAYGIDSLFSYDYNGGRTGLVVSSAYTSTHVIPVVDQKPLLAQATRLSWGGFQNAEFLLKLVRLKYPAFPGKISDPQAEDLVREHCYVSADYEDELSRYLDWTGLEDRDHIVQFPYTEQVVVQKTEEELAAAAEKRKESGRRLQAQAAKMRLEKLKRKEEEHAYYVDLRQQVQNTTKKEGRRLLDSNDFDDETQLERRIRDLDRSIRKSRNKDVGDDDGDGHAAENEPPSFPLLDVPDDQLDEDELKQKRQQRLSKSNHDARQRAKAEKEREKARVAEEQRVDAERREKNFDSWVGEKHLARQAIVTKIKERERLKADLGNRKSLANQMRMKSIATLASDNPTKKRRRGADEDTFGADDADWGVYRTIAPPGGDGSDDDEENEMDAELSGALRAVETQLLEHDPGFSEANTHAAQQQGDWTSSLLHAFTHGPWPFAADAPRETHQLHLNVERIRVPEVVFQPSSIAGLDQAGLVEIVSDVLLRRPGDAAASASAAAGSDAVLRALVADVFLTGGNTLLPGFRPRVAADLRTLLPVDAEVRVRAAGDAVLDAWRGAARWAASPAARHAFVPRDEYLEKGPEWFRDHRLGNMMA